MLKGRRLSKSYFIIALYAFIATLGLNVDLSFITTLDNFRIEGYPITRYQEVTGHLSSSMETIATFFAGFSGNSVLWLCIFLALCLLFARALAVTDIRIKRYSYVTAAVFSMLYVIGFSIERYSSLLAVTGSGATFLRCVIAFIGIAFLFDALLKIFFDKIMHCDFKDVATKKLKILEVGRKPFFQRCGVIFLCWLPYLIVYLPGFLSRDTVVQLDQTLGNEPLISHHPIFMTGVSTLFIRIGMFFGSANIGLLLYSLFQMILMASAFSYVLKCMAQQRIYLPVRGFTLLYFMLYPVHAFYSIMMWKDSLFSIVFMLLILKTIQMVSRPEEFFKSKQKVVTFALLCVALFLTRNNGIHMLILFFPVLLFALRKYWKSLAVVITLVAICFISLQIVSSALHVQKGSAGEALSVPLQQIARTVKYHGDELSAEEKELIVSFLEFDRLSELYEPTISDPIKSGEIFNEAAFQEDTTSFISLWARLFAKYPITYLEAFLCHTHGYWYPDIDYWIVAREMWQNNYDIYSWLIVPSFINNLFSGIFVFRVFPVLSMLVSIGFACWVTIIAALILLLKRRYKMLPVFLLAFLLWLTCIASPVSGMFRYIYGLFLALPLFISVALQEEKWRGKLQ